MRQWARRSRQPSRRSPARGSGPDEGCQERLQLELGLCQLCVGVGTDDDAVASVKDGAAARDGRAAQPEGPLAVPPAVDPADWAGITSSVEALVIALPA